MHAPTMATTVWLAGGIRLRRGSNRRHRIRNLRRLKVARRGLRPAPSLVSPAELYTVQRRKTTRWCGLQPTRWGSFCLAWAGSPRYGAWVEAHATAIAD